MSNLKTLKHQASIAIILLLGLMPLSLSAYDLLCIVKDSLTGNPIPNAMISFKSECWVADGEGNWDITLDSSNTDTFGICRFSSNIDNEWAWKVEISKPSYTSRLYTCPGASSPAFDTAIIMMSKFDSTINCNIYGTVKHEWFPSALASDIVIATAPPCSLFVARKSIRDIYFGTIDSLGKYIINVKKSVRIGIAIFAPGIGLPPIYSTYPLGYRIEYCTPHADTLINLNIPQPYSAIEIKSKGKDPNNLFLTCSPNPITTSANFYFYTSSPQFYQMNIYDSKGSHIETVINSIIGSGIHTARWNSTKRPTGFYYCILLGRQSRQVIKVLHIN